MMESSTASLPGNNGHGEEIRPYKIHVSSRFRFPPFELRLRLAQIGKACLLTCAPRFRRSIWILRGRNWS